MVTLSLWEKVKFFFKSDYIEIEEHPITCQSIGKKAEKEHIYKLANHLEETYPRLKVVSVRQSNWVEFRNNPFFSFSGYVLRLTPNVDLKELKRSCMEFETDITGKHICDIDIYYGGKKISRHDPLYNFFIS